MRSKRSCARSTCTIRLHFQEDSERAKCELRCRRVLSAGGPSSRGLHDVPEGPDNLVVRRSSWCGVARAFAAAPGCCWSSGFRRRPGLGGGSSDAAAALVAANEGWRLGRSRDELAAWAAELGSDVPFFLADGPAVCRGRGERVEPVAGLARLCFVVVYPPAGLSTAAVYGRVGRPRRRGRCGRLLEALRRGDLETGGPAVVESVAARRRSVVALGEAFAAGVLTSRIAWGTE